MTIKRKVLFVGGKGGVGKSTSASALALTYARKNKKTLLVSTDPAHNIGDVFHVSITNKIKNVYPNLDAIEIDPTAESKKYIMTVKDNIRGLVKPQHKEEIDKQIDAAGASPGAEEAALFDRMVSVILEEGIEYDMVIFDTAPTGHTIRLLTLPELMGVWIDGMLERRRKRNQTYTQLLNDGEPIEDPIYRVLQTRKERFAAVREILLNKECTEFIFILNPERLPILETAKALKQLKKYDLEVGTIIINKLLSNGVEGDFWVKRKETEKEYMKWIEREFSVQRKCYIPLFETDINSVDLLESYSNFLKPSLAHLEY